MPSPGKESLGAFLRHQREKVKKVTRATAAAACGIDESTIYRIEEDLQEPLFSTIKCFSIYYNVPLDVLAEKEITAQRKKKVK